MSATKIGGWPSCIQSEPWWDYREEGREFVFAFQIASEEKANCYWGDAGTVYVARSKRHPNMWAIDSQLLVQLDLRQTEHQTKISDVCNVRIVAV